MPEHRSIARSSEVAPSSTLAWFISGHGFGHASRDVEVLNALQARRPDLRVILRSAVSPELLRRTMRFPYELRAGETDTGVIQSSSVAHDDDATLEAAIAFHAGLDAKAEAEAAALAGDDVTLVVGDIPPLAFETAARLGVPSIAVANFTWDWIYETHPGFSTRGASTLEIIRRAYRRATRALELPFAAGFEIFDRVERVPLVARRPTRGREDTRAHFGIPADRPAILLSFGGYGLPLLDLSTIDCLDEWTVITTDRISQAQAGRPPRNVVFVVEDQFLTGGFRYEDLVGAVDVVMTKPGYGILSECMATGTAVLYTSRGTFREYPILVDALERYTRSRFIDQHDLFAGRWRASLTALLRQPLPRETMAVDGADVIARIIDVALGGTTGEPRGPRA